MQLTSGVRLGPYEIVQPLGAGGMGEVYHAKDTRLERSVAIKVLPADFARNAQFQLRFDREAKTISSLNHPHICALYDVGRENGTQYLVLEYLEGETLADRLTKGPLAPDQAMRAGIEIAEALDRAHRQGITHRDLKPANVMLTKSGVKLLDFGLAKDLETGFVSQTAPIDEPTQQRPLTEQGTIVGTMQYMSPEQLEGREADPRSDIFALGAVLYEAITGRRAFDGKSRTSLIAAIVTSQPPPLSSIKPLAPPALEHVVAKCLEKDPDDRWQSARDVAAELSWISTAGSQAGIAAPVTIRRRTREALAWGTAAALAVAVGVGATAWLTRVKTPPQQIRFTIPPPVGTNMIAYDELGVSLSPDGRKLAFVAMASDGSKKIYVRSLDSWETRPVPETDGAWYPFWSPDGRYLAYFADGFLKKVDLRGGSPQNLAPSPTGRGGSWGPDGTILFAPNLHSAIYRVPANGGAAEAVTSYDPKSEGTQRWPVFMPDGKHFVYISRATVGGRDVGRLKAASLGDMKARTLLEDATNAAYVSAGYLLFGRSGNLLAQKFDPESMELSGDPVPLTDAKLAWWEPKNLLVYAASPDGTVVFLPESFSTGQLQWVDRTGKTIAKIGETAYLRDGAISPDGKKIAYVRLTGTTKGDVWLYDVARERNARVTFESGTYGTPIWSRDGNRLTFLCQPKSVADICVKDFMTGEVRTAVESAGWKAPGGFLTDGKSFFFNEQSAQTNEDLMIGSLDPAVKPRVFLRTPFDEQWATVSPDGRWVAFQSNETGTGEVYVRAVNGSADQWQISTGGGFHPRWRGDSRELLYVSATNKLMSVDVEPGTTFQPSEPHALFDVPPSQGRDVSVFEDVAPDGQRFLLNVPTQKAADLALQVIVNPTFAPAAKN